jgi:hypothetical protein
LYGAEIVGVAAENFSSTASGTNIDFRTTPIGTTTTSQKMRLTSEGNLGIGTTAPSTKLEVAGQVKITGGTPGAGKVLTSDATGLATWTTPVVVGGLGGAFNPIGTTNLLMVAGDAEADVPGVTQTFTLTSSATVNVIATGIVSNYNVLTVSDIQGSFKINVNGTNVTAAFASSGHRTGLGAMPSPITLSYNITLAAGTHTIKLRYKPWYGGANLNVDAYTVPYAGAIAALTNNDLSKLTIVGWNGTQWISIPSTATGRLTTGTIKTDAAITPNAYNVYTFAAAATNIIVAPKAFLSGAYVSATGMMYDSLRVKGFVPSAQPYNSMGYAGTETVMPSVLATTGANAIVDWVLIQLRSDTSTVVAQQAALIQRDGDIVSTDGISPLTFAGVNAGNYYVVVKHRNHLGVMTANALALTSTATSVDFTVAATPNYQLVGNFGTVYAQRTIGAVRTLWSGNTGGGNAVKATGASSDAESILFKVLLDAGNVDLLPTFILYNGYFREDGNLDGKVIYQGSGSEFDMMLFNVLLHGNNSSVLPNFIIYEQIP